MSDAIKELHDYLAKSPSVVYPEDVLVYLSAIEAENAALRELVADTWVYISHPADATWTHMKRKEARHSLSDRIRELGIEVE